MTEPSASTGPVPTGPGSAVAAGGGAFPSGGATGNPGVLCVRFDCSPGQYPDLLELLADLTPVVQALPPDAALADLRGALRFFDRSAAQLADVLRVRALAGLGVGCTAGVAGNPLLARMAMQQGPQGLVLTVPDDPVSAAAFLHGLPVAALHGVGPATARTLASYGLTTVDRLAGAPLATLQRLLGARTARRLHERARGIDPVPVVPSAPARSTAAEHRFDHQELDAGRRRRALLTLADRLGLRMRHDRQVARALTLTVRYADRSTTTRTRVLPEPTAHTPALTDAAYALHDALGLQRARVRALTLRAEDLGAASLSAHQLSLDPGEERARRAEAAADRARARFGAGAVRPAGALPGAA